jgi:transcriptional regulator with XRE-family HTH domain
MPRQKQPKDLERGQRVADLRKAVGPHLTQERLAQEIGVAARTIQHWEQGDSLGSPEKLARYFHTTVAYIMTGQESNSNDLVDRFSRQQEILRRVASNRLLTAEQLEFLERALDELEHGTHPDAKPSPEAAGEEAA